MKTNLIQPKCYATAVVVAGFCTLAFAPLLSAQTTTDVPAVTESSAEIESPESTPQSKPATSDAASESAPQAANDSKPPKEKARRVYLGRIVAKPMSYHGANWLVRPEREQEENVRVAFSQLGLKPGMTACDFGCGNGFWTLPIAKVVGEKGKVLAVDIQPEMLELLRTRALKASIENVEPIHSRISDPKLPEGEVDLLLMVDVYHEFSHPESMLWGIRRSLSSTGVVALLEYREEDALVPIKPLHKMSKSQIIKEYEANGLKLVREFNDLPWQHLMFFARDDSPLKQIEPVPGHETVKLARPKE